MRVLIAEDDKISRSFLKKFLDRYGECDTAVNGVEALDKFVVSIEEKQVYDLICLDIMMPKMDGIKVLENIRTLQKKHKTNKTKIIMTSALNDEKTVNRADDLGCDGYFWKPLDLKELEAGLKDLDLI